MPSRLPKPQYQLLAQLGREGTVLERFRVNPCDRFNIGGQPVKVQPALSLVCKGLLDVAQDFDPRAYGTFDYRQKLVINESGRQYLAEFS